MLDGPATFASGLSPAWRAAATSAARSGESADRQPYTVTQTSQHIQPDSLRDSRGPRPRRLKSISRSSAFQPFGVRRLVRPVA
jgi:hypothetical protein